MCGIVGFTGHRQAAPVLLDGLAKLEYRGYDSAGLAVRDGEKEVEIVKAKGRLRVLAEKTNDGMALHGTCGIGHTRWATHGEPSELNAHPHCSDDRNVVGVHNGIIENYQELREKLQHKGYSFYSDTDTEVAIKLIDYYYKKYEHTPVDAINHGADPRLLCIGGYVQGLSGRDLCGEKGQSDDHRCGGRRIFCCIGCSGYFEVYKKCLLYRKYGDVPSAERQCDVL